MDYELFKGSYRKRFLGKYHVISEILWKSYEKCPSTNVYPDGPLLQGEAMKIAK